MGLRSSLLPSSRRQKAHNDLCLVGTAGNYQSFSLFGLHLYLFPITDLFSEFAPLASDQVRFTCRAVDNKAPLEISAAPRYLIIRPGDTRPQLPWVAMCVYINSLSNHET